MNDEIKLIVELDEDIGLYHFIVKAGDEILHYRPGFRSHHDAEETGDQWIRDHLGAAPLS